MKIIFYLPLNTDRPKFVAFLVFVCMTSSLITQISSVKNVSKRDAILAPVTKQWIAKDILSSESQSKCALICALFTDLVNTKTKFGRIYRLNDLLLSLRDHLLKPQWQPCVILHVRLERFRYEMGALLSTE